jgi:hypothetical protein
MHHGAEVTPNILAGLGIFYLLCALLNGGAAAFVWQRFQRAPVALLWAGLALAYLALAGLGFAGSHALVLPQGFRDFVNGIAGPVTYTLGAVALFTLFIVFRGFFVKPAVAWAGLNLVLLFFGFSMTDANFRLIVGKPDNVPISGMIFLLGFFTWLGMWKAVRNDRRISQGRPLIEQEQSEKVLVWPDLVYTELICMVLITVLLVVWSIPLKAPLEQPASDLKTPNPSKAPWYFLGLQEMLVYYDPWMAGVVLPSFIIVGLMAMPYIDFNKLGNGYYTFNQRKFAMVMFLFGFIVLWVTLILLGTFLRGPNWNFFGPYEPWDVHKVEALNNVQFSEYFWIWMMGRGLPREWYLRELPGIILVLVYLFGVPPLLGLTVFRKFLVKMGFIRFMVLALLLLFMAALPIKMVLRWTINLKYIVYIPEFFFNI